MPRLTQSPNVVRHLMRPAINIILTLIFGISYGQDFSYPSIIIKGEKLNNFLPVGWTIIDSASGDLNKDGSADVAIILQHKDSVQLIKSRDSVITQPRILIVLLKNTSDNSFHLLEQSNSFILNHDNSMMDDPFRSLTIDKGIIKLDFYLFYNIGSWYTTSGSYKFRFDGKEFILIGADLTTIHRATLEYEDYSYNFLTKKRRYTKGNEQKGTKKTTQKNIFISSFMTFKTFIQPFSWEIEKNVFL